MRPAAALGLLALLGGPAGLSGQVPCAPEPPSGAPAWAAPLDRPITVRGGTMPLREALSRIAAAARVRLTYASDLLPLDRVTCLDFTARPAGAVLTAVLRGTAVSPVAASRDLVVLAADRTPAPAPVADPFERPVVLAGIRVDAEAARPAGMAGVAGTSIDGRLLEQQGASTLAEALDGVVPGVWVWPGGGALAQYGSLRGASSFGIASPKLYIDGLEVANPLLVSSLDPATVERVEVLRGPQGAALHGGDALAGVTHVITRQGAIDGSGSRATVRSGLGHTGSAFTPAGALAQDHGISLFAGGPSRSARLDVSFSGLGERVPDAASSTLSAVGSARSVHERFAISATARYLSEHWTLGGVSPLLAAGSDVGRDVAVGQYTAGVTAAYQPNDVWTHTVVAGVNGYTVAGAPTAAEAVSAADSALAAAGTSALRTTLRLTSAARLALGRRAAGALTFTAEHSALSQDGGLAIAPLWTQPEWWGRPAAPRYTWPPPAWQRPGQTASQGTSPSPEPAPDPDAADYARERASTGLGGRLDATLFGRLNLSTGLRVEHTTLENGIRASALLPSLGGAWNVLARDGLDLTLRAAYGKGVRWPQVPAFSSFVRTLRLAPEVQSGIEAGADLQLGRALSLQATRFDQVATGMTQLVAVARDSAPGMPAGTTLTAQNVGAIANRGWELAAVTRSGPLTLSGTLTLVDSRVRAVAAGYTGDLADGDRMLAVPARTASLSALWNRPRWSASLSLSRAFDWINYDRLALARAGADSLDIATADLRDYWLHYHGTTRLRASFSRDLGRRLSLRLTGDNLLDVQTGEPDNATVIPGRALSLSVRAKL